MKPRGPRLYDLLPRYVRFRDAEEGRAIEALMASLEVPYRVLQADIGSLYRGWFIETCAEWQIPYIGDLVGVRGLEEPRRLVPTQRARVANAVAYRRSKGTAAALERAAQDATGWGCRVIEYRRTTATTATLLRPDPTAPGTVDLRREADLELLGGPFNRVVHGVELKPCREGNPPLGDRGGFNLPNVGLAFWRLACHPVEGATPRRVERVPRDLAGRCFTFDPFGGDVPLFTPPRTANGPVYANSPENLSLPLRRRAASSSLAPPAAGGVEEEPPFRIFVATAGDGELRALPSAEIAIADLAGWRVANADLGSARAVVDPVRGRFVLAPGEPLEKLRVDYGYGAAMDLGGGPYRRREPVHRVPAGGFRAIVRQGCERRFDAAARLHWFPSLGEALGAWNEARTLPIPPPRRAPAAPRDGLIRIVDNGTYEAGWRVNLKGRRLVIEAADGCRPFLAGGLDVTGSPRAVVNPMPPWSRGEEGGSLAGESELLLSGVWLDGILRLEGGVALALDHCTVNPPRPGRQAGPAVELVDGGTAGPIQSSLRAHRSIVGALRLETGAVDLEVIDSIVDGGGGPAIVGPAAEAVVERSTLVGEVDLGRLRRALSALFTRPVRAALVGEGLVRCCHLPDGSRTPRAEPCHGAAMVGSGTGEVAAPVFVATSYGHPAYLQLAPTAPPAIRLGGEDGNEVGVHNQLRQGDRLANLPAVLDELLPWGCAARVFFVT